MAAVIRVFHCLRRFFFLAGEFLRIGFERRQAMLATKVVRFTVMFMVDEFTFLIGRHPANRIRILAFFFVGLVVHYVPPFTLRATVSLMHTNAIRFKNGEFHYVIIEFNRVRIHLDFKCNRLAGNQLHRHYLNPDILHIT
jgi:hypothetical protein